MRAQGVRDLLGGDEQVERAVRLRHRIAQSDRGACHVSAPDVQCPGDAVQRGEHRRIRPTGFQPLGDVGEFVLMAFPRIFEAMRDGGREAGGRAVGPDRVDGVGIYRDQLRALRLQRRPCFRHPVAGVQPRIIADTRACLRFRSEPVCGLGRGEVAIGVERAIHLIAHLQRVAPVGEDRRRFGEHHRTARRSAEAGQPGEALGIAADIFAHVLVGQRDDEAVELPGGEFGAQGGKAVGGSHSHKSLP
jgi:hypothetical protein